MTATFSPVLTSRQEARIECLLQRACKANLLLTTAESCTGGLIASLLTDVPGCSHAFAAGFVAYSDDAKMRLLDLPPSLLDVHGAVSEAAALAMVDGALARSGADIAISVTGFAESTDAREEAGLVFVGGGNTQGKRACLENHFGDVGRSRVRLRSVDAALEMMELVMPAWA